MKILLIKLMGCSESNIYRGNFIAPNTYIRKEISKINNLSFHKRKLETEEQNKCKVRRRRKRRKKIEINEIENRKTLEKITVATIYLKR